MLLKNKKTGETRNAVDIDMYTDSVYLKVSDGEFDNETIEYHSLAELNEEWCDAPEEPKEYWYINADGELFCEPSDDRCGFDNKCREIGNYFSSREEAEKAVERLRAWKRLKDKGFRFTGYDTNYGHHRASFVFEKEAWATETEPDLDLLFGGEE